MSEFNVTMDITMGGEFTITITGDADDVGYLETDVFQPAVSAQLVEALRAKNAERAALRELGIEL